MFSGQQKIAAIAAIAVIVFVLRFLLVALAGVSAALALRQILPSSAKSMKVFGRAGNGKGAVSTRSVFSVTNTQSWCFFYFPATYQYLQNIQ